MTRHKRTWSHASKANNANEFKFKKVLLAVIEENGKTKPIYSKWVLYYS